MPAKRLSILLSETETTEIRGSGDPIITSIRYDSRAVTKGSLFVAITGFHVDGHDYISDAIARGAAAVVAERPETAGAVPPDVPLVVVPRSRPALSSIAAVFYDHPSRDLLVIGVTGTDGKSSTVAFIEQILTAAGFRTGLISTVTVKTGDTLEKNPNRQSTPEAVELQSYLADMRTAGKEVAVVEATSHGLSARTSRLADVDFDLAVFTNLSHEHLEFHGSFEQYRDDKANLFRALDRAPRGGEGIGGRAAGASGGKDRPGRFAVVNAGDEHGEYMAGATRHPTLRYGISDEPAGSGLLRAAPTAVLELSARAVSPGIDGTSFTLSDDAGNSRSLRLPMPGVFQVENVLAALLAAAGATGRSPLELADAVETLVPVEGRLVPVGRKTPFAVVVDYAHTPNSYEKLFPIIRASTPGRIIALFGSAGERDIEKRALQGAVAARHCELIVLCDEDPRGEEPEAILRAIEEGINAADPHRRKGEGYLVIEDRRTAIRAAVDRAEPGDTIVLLGKGHERSIIYADGPRPWNEAEVALEVLIEAGYEQPRQEATT
ncbi:MAG: UDP-N-acetylmuramoyl-L-alanyl-D-glutamate--2,6-diaminopimelate ligase [Spirochaetes bacterium]|jgi:UDP-N-acetylmuramoyl-L-alanyl-D-glutamate--2,6-diaminopimelate ligase|nr:UDP-N-acetylmuramoyl-L-alanyl-D-glutamate--2,6-diaminopimelate ligase [Spirochaetota bacterium]